MLLILLVVLVNAIPYRKLVNIDNAYISYRYAENLLRHGQLVYNLVGDKAFAATSPGYTVVLAALGALGMPIDFAGYAIGIAAILVAAWALMDLLRKWPLHAGVGAGLLLALLPLSWLVIGMESVPVMALVLLSYTLTFRRHYAAAAVLLILATIFRFDAVAAAGAWGLWLLLTLRAKAIRPIVVYGAGTLLIYAALRVFLNVPLPTTLASKQAQVALGVTGFAPHTTYASGIGLLAQAHTAQTAIYWLAGIFALVGLAGLLVLSIGRRPARLDEPSRETVSVQGSLDLAPVLLLALWAVAHLAAYLILGVTPYLWYYLPFFPLAAALISLGVTLAVLGLARIWRAARRPKVAQGLAALLWAVVLVGPAFSHLSIRQTQPELGGGKQPVADSLLLPGGQWGPYKSMGEWLKANTPPETTAGMMEIGIPGYYSQRHVVDFLGLLDTDIANALTAETSRGRCTHSSRTTSCWARAIRCTATTCTRIAGSRAATSPHTSSRPACPAATGGFSTTARPPRSRRASSKAFLPPPNRSPFVLATRSSWSGSMRRHRRGIPRIPPASRCIGGC